MKILIAPDKFKGSLTADEVCGILTDELIKKHPETEVTSIPLADGGEGSLEVLERTLKFERVHLQVTGPLFEKVDAWYGFVDQTAYIEMAKASGLPLLNANDRNPLRTTTYGTGEMIKHAMKQGATTIYLFVGGSATNEAGLGMAQALGYRFYDALNNELVPVGESLTQVHKIKNTQGEEPLEKINFYVVTDVQNPLTGRSGATMVYAAQKGATGEMIPKLENGMNHFADIAENHFQKSAKKTPGSGAAGGLGAGAIWFLGAEILSGIQTIMGILNIEKQIESSDVVFTGEGKLDNQSLQGKVIHGVVTQSRKADKPCFIFCGHYEPDTTNHPLIPNDHIFTLQQEGLSKKYAIDHAEMLLRQAVKRWMALYLN